LALSSVGFWLFFHIISLALRDYLALLVMTRWWQFLGWLAVMLVYIR